MKLWLLIFFGTLTLVRRAQRNNHFANSKMDGNGGVGNPTAASLGIFPNEEHGVTTLRDSVEEGNMQRVVAILQSNIKQWSFIEAQLLEPNVNLGMVSHSHSYLLSFHLPSFPHCFLSLSLSFNHNSLKSLFL